MVSSDNGITYRRFDFGHEALDYISSEIKRYQGRYGLRGLLAELPIGTGTAFAFIPVRPPTNRTLGDRLRNDGAEVFRHSLFHTFGGLEAVGTEYRQAELTFISRWLRDKEHRLVLFQTDYFRFERGRTIRCSAGERLLLFEAHGAAESPEGWVAVDVLQSTPEDISLAQARGMSPYPPTLGLLTLKPGSLDLSGKIEFADVESMKALAMEVRYIVVGACDGELLLFWQRNEPRA